MSPIIFFKRNRVSFIFGWKASRRSIKKTSSNLRHSIPNISYESTISTSVANSPFPWPRRHFLSESSTPIFKSSKKRVKKRDPLERFSEGKVSLPQKILLSLQNQPLI